MYQILIVAHPDNLAEAQIVSDHLRSLGPYNPVLFHVALGEMDTISIKDLLGKSSAVLVIDHDHLYSDMTALAVITAAQKTSQKLGFISTIGFMSRSFLNNQFSGSTLDYSRNNFLQGLELFLLTTIHN